MQEPPSAEFTNLSVGRGTNAAFEQVGRAPGSPPMPKRKNWRTTLTARKLVGVTFAAVTFTPEKPYPYAGQAIPRRSA